MTLGARPHAGGVCFRLWAPVATSVALHVRKTGHRGQILIFALERSRKNQDLTPVSPAEDVWEIDLPGAAAGDRYAYSIDARDPLPDPVSRFQPDGVHGWSEIIDPTAFAWTDTTWRGLDPHRAVIYELHVGTFTREGTFAAATTKLPHLKDLGVTAVELMPVADFAGRRNWGYDGAALFAPSRAYGRPDDLRAFVDAAHALDLAVLIDVVYNHLGPEGAYLPSFSPRFLTPAHRTPWGDAVNLDDDGNAGVRRLLLDNALHWIGEYHADGLRLDAIHSLIDNSDRPFVAQLSSAVHGARRPRPLVYAEDSRNLAYLVQDPARGGWGVDGVWADDFHHVVRRMVAGDDYSYYVDYQGTARELADILRHGWLYSGQHSRHWKAPRGTSAGGVAMRAAVVCVQNHDQVGNRALGDRLHHRIDPAVWRAVVAVLLTSPMTPLLFMGQEWAASTPFQFFTDFEPDLGEKIVEGRRAEFRGVPEFSTPEAARRIPNPQADATFEASRLNWDERADPQHATSLALHQALLRLRDEHPELHASDDCTCEARAVNEDTVMFTRPGRERSFLVVARLRGAGEVQVNELTCRTWQPVLETEDPRFARDPRPPIVDTTRGSIDFTRPGAILFQRAGG